MSDLKEKDLVMTEHGLAWYVKFCPANDAGLYDASNQVKLLTGETYFLDATPTKATKEQVTEYIRGLGHYMNNDEVIVHGSVIFFDALDCIRIKPCQLGERDFPTALAQLAEAIQVAQLFNAVKD